MALGNYIKEVRCFLKITQKELAKKAGISYQQLSQYERGVRTPKNKTVEKIAEAMGFSMMEFMRMYYLSSANVPQEDKNVLMAVEDISQEPLEGALVALKQLMNAGGYNLSRVKGEYYLTGKNGGYRLTDTQVQTLLNCAIQDIGTLCEMLEIALSQLG